MLFIAGLPGVGKSLLLRELAEAAHGYGRAVHLLQWDVARRLFDAPALLARYPEVDGITHAVLRKAAGLWARDAISRMGLRSTRTTARSWRARPPSSATASWSSPGPAPMPPSPLLVSDTTRFLVPVPTVEVRRAIEAARAATTASPRHERERADAVPNVLRLLWGELLDAAAQLAAERGGAPPVDVGYDPDTYLAVYTEALRQRNWEPLPVEVALPPQSRSVYAVDAPAVDLAPTEAEAEAYVARVEREYPDLDALRRETAAWWRA